jgi:hypothetical protein
VFFPEVIVATAAEQWLSAYQSVQIFAGLSPGRDISREKSLPHRSEYENSAIDLY